MEKNGKPSAERIVEVRSPRIEDAREFCKWLVAVAGERSVAIDAADMDTLDAEAPYNLVAIASDGEKPCDESLVNGKIRRYALMPPLVMFMSRCAASMMKSGVPEDDMREELRAVVDRWKRALKWSRYKSVTFVDQLKFEGESRTRTNIAREVGILGKHERLLNTGIEVDREARKRHVKSTTETELASDVDRAARLLDSVDQVPALLEVLHEFSRECGESCRIFRTDVRLKTVKRDGRIRIAVRPHIIHPSMAKWGMILDTARDGMGSQYWRRISIMALAAKFGFEYIHIPLHRAAHAPPHMNSTRWGRLCEEFLGIARDYMQADDAVKAGLLTKHLADTGVLEYVPVPEYAGSFLVTTGGFSPLKLKPPLRTECIAALGNRLFKNYASGAPMPPPPADPVRVCVHVRRGDISEIARSRDDGLSWRYRSPAEFAETARTILDALSGLDVDVTVFSERDEADPMNEELMPFAEMGARIVMDEQDHPDCNLFETIHHMIYADVLVMSASSLSEMCAIIGGAFKIKQNEERRSSDSPLTPSEMKRMSRSELRSLLLEGRDKARSFREE